MKILIFPKGDNPYQELLYGKLRRKHPGNQYTYYTLNANRLLFFPLFALGYRIRGYSIFHIHWPAFAINRSIPGITYISLLHALICLTSLRLLRYKIVWTVHNVLPHNTETANDTLVARYLASIASAKIAHSQTTIADMAAKKLSTDNVTILPHGNYVDWYRQTATRLESRKKFGIPYEAFVVVMVGRIEPYKNVPKLVSACMGMSADRPIHLLIGGKADATTTSQLRAQADHTVHLRLHFIEDDDIQYFFAAADVAAYPFTRITTSGSVLLALSFGVPIVAPRIGALADMPAEVGFFYDPRKTSLQEVLQNVVLQPRKLTAARSAVAAYCATLDWSGISDATHYLYETVEKNDRT